jgi:hypothetical protein
MQIAISRWVVALLLAVAFQILVAPANAEDATDHVAIQGYDVVAYFTDGKATKGSSDISLPFEDSRWQFASTAHKEMFAADPDRYMPQYGGSCAGGMVLGMLVAADPENWVIVDGKLYMISGTKADLEAWMAHAAENIAAADKKWTKTAGQQ